MARAVPLPEGVGDLFKGCKDQNENQLVPGFCPFIMQGEPVSLSAGLCLLLKAQSTHMQAYVEFRVKAEKVKMHTGVVDLSVCIRY